MTGAQPENGVNMKSIISVLLLTCITLAASDLSVSGQVAPQVMVSKEGDYIRLPYKLFQLDLGLSRENVALTAAIDLEYSQKLNSIDPKLNEAYLNFSHGFGELYLGKQVTTWGSADANNPTDNVNPFDYYYLFLEGADRKIGNVMLREEIFYKSLSVSLVLVPLFTPARLPINDPDLPFIPAVPFYHESKVKKPAAEAKNTEYGIRARLSLSRFEVAASYFEGNDRQFAAPNPMDFTFAYPRTRVIGLEGIGLYGDFALRAEGAYFLTEDREGDELFVRNPYFQYVAQVDWNAPARTMCILQYLGMASTLLDDDTEKETEDALPVGMGALFCGFAKSAVMAVVKKDIGDAPHQAEVRVLYDIDKEGYMTGGSFSFSPAAAFYLKAGINYFDGSKGSVFERLNGFTHLFLQAKYSF
jgi:hypothetical protein